MPPAPISLTDWIAHVFDHPVTDPAWHWDIHTQHPDLSAEQALLYIAETCERAPELLASYTDAQLDQGFWYLLGCNSDYLPALYQLSVPWPARRRVLRSFLPLFRDFMAVRCTPQLSHCETADCPLNGVCYMWWDMDSVPPPRREEPAWAEQDREVLAIMAELLTIPHDACRESALHGLNHWQLDYPGEVETIITTFLRHTPGLRPELAAYAEGAITGMMQ
jgi:hypothetical protein